MEQDILGEYFQKTWQYLINYENALKIFKYDPFSCHQGDASVEENKTYVIPLSCSLQVIMGNSPYVPAEWILDVSSTISESQMQTTL